MIDLSGEGRVALSTGIDLIEIHRIAKAVDRFGDRFLNRIYTAREISYSRGRIPELAVRFAAKEAVTKALGTGLRGVAWREIEVISDRRGKPHVILHGGAADRAKKIGLNHFAVSLTHSVELGAAFVVASHRPDADGTQPPSGGRGERVRANEDCHQ